MSEKQSSKKVVKPKGQAARGSVIESKEAGGGRFSLTISPFSDAQVLRLFARTPKQYIKKRPAKGGGEWEYVSGAYMQKVLNYVFGFLWNFEVIKAWEAGFQVVTHGRLTINYLDSNGDVKVLIFKDQFGRADIKYKKDTQIPLDLGNDYKASATDCFKKCASQLGIAGDIYAKEEFRDIKAEPVDSENSETRSTGELNEKTAKALDALGIDKTNITNQKEAEEAIKNATAKKKGGA